MIRRPVPWGTQNAMDPALTWKSPVRDAAGKVIRAEPAFTSTWTRWTAATAPRSTLTEPAFPWKSRVPRCAPARPRVPLPALSWMSTSTVGSWGKVTVHASRLPKLRKPTLASRERMMSRSGEESMRGSAPLFDVPVRAQPPSDRVPTVRSPQVNSRRTRLFERVPCVAGKAVPESPPHDRPRPERSVPTANRPPSIRPRVAAAMRPPAKSSGVRRSRRPTPPPMIRNGHNCHDRAATSRSSALACTASGTTPTSRKNTPQFRKRLSIHTVCCPPPARRSELAAQGRCAPHEGMTCGVGDRACAYASPRVGLVAYIITIAEALHEPAAGE